MHLHASSMHGAAEGGAREVVHMLLADAGQAASRLEARDEGEALHDFRVALRRLRSAPRALGPWLPGVPRRMERRLKELAAATGTARNAEVQLAWLSDQRLTWAPRERPGIDLLIGRLKTRRTGGTHDHRRLLSKYRRLARRLDRRLRDGGEGRGREDFANVMAARVDDHVAAFVRRARRIRGAVDARRIHRVRIAGKRLRYLLEQLRDLPGLEASATLKRLKRLQDVLGDLHDTHLLAREVGAVLVEAEAARARRLHAIVSEGPPAASVREALGPSPRPGLLAVARRLRERRDGLFGELESSRHKEGLDALGAEVAALAAALRSAGSEAPLLATHPGHLVLSRRH